MKFSEKINLKNKNISIKKMKSIIKQKLKINGYNSDVSSKVIEILNIDKDENNERINLALVANKAKKRYEVKTGGVQLRNKVFRYCSSQGFDYNDIYIVLSEMEWDNEQKN